MGLLGALFGRNEEGAPNVWLHWQDHGDGRVGPFWRHGRVWVNGKHNSCNFSWKWFAKNCGFEIRFSDLAIGCDCIEIYLGIPYMLSLWLGVERSIWIRRLPGVGWNGSLNSGQREISVKLYEGMLFWELWSNQNLKLPKWRSGGISFSRLIYGRPKRKFYSVCKLESIDIRLPEGRYSLELDVIEKVVQWPRWPLVERTIIYEFNAINGEGIPVPGKGENSWNLDDDFITLFSVRGDKYGVIGAIEKVVDIVMKTRERYASMTWIPDDGWPIYCDKDVDG